MKKANKSASATKSTAKTAAKKAPVKKATKKTATKKVAVKKSTAKKTAVKKTAANKTAPVAAEYPVTTIRAKIDIGFGNLLYLRGDGPGLSWEKGIALECVDDIVWNWSTNATVKAFTYKVLVNDLSWSVGEDYTAHSGKVNAIKPTF